MKSMIKSALFRSATRARNFVVFLAINLFLATTQLFAGFPIGTPVATSAGPVPIEYLIPGSLIVGFEEEEVRLMPMEIKAIHDMPKQAHVIAITTENARFVVTTDQLIFDAGTQTSIAAQHWTTANQFLTKDGQVLPTLGVEQIAADALTFCEMAIEIPHLFFAFREEILVHNAQASDAIACAAA